MLFMSGLPDGMMALEADQTNLGDINIGHGCRWKARHPDMDGNFDSENWAYDEEAFRSAFEEDEWSDEPSGFDPSGEEE